jgi:hypothetical protein
MTDLLLEETRSVRGHQLAVRVALRVVDPVVDESQSARLSGQPEEVRCDEGGQSADESRQASEHRIRRTSMAERWR